MARKKSTKKQASDFYAEGTNFSDDPEDSFYATEDEDLQKKSSSKEGNRKKFFGFYTWELLVVIGEILLVIYLFMVFLGLIPLL